MSPSELPLNEKVDLAVKKYAEAIVEYVRTLRPDIELIIEEDLASDEGDTCSASIIDLQTEMALITIFPDFHEQSSKAAMLNKGLISAMELEGFDDEEINNAPVYSGLLPFSIDNAEIFAILLTEDMDIQHQKNIYNED
jgi:hypothetical protein